MKDLTDAELIEMDRRATRLLVLLDENPKEMTRDEKDEALNAGFMLMGQVAKDVETLCAHIRAKATE